MAEDDLHPEPEQPFDASDPVQIKKRELAAARRDHRKRAALAKFLADPGGREWLWDILNVGNAFSISFRVGQPDATAFNEGRRDLANRILEDWITASPETYIATLRKRAKGLNG